VAHSPAAPRPRPGSPTDELLGLTGPDRCWRYDATRPGPLPAELEPDEAARSPRPDPDPETLQIQGELTAARTLEEQVLDARRQMLGDDHPDTLIAMGNLAALDQELKAAGDGEQD
jgi:hypothetical protein